MEKRIYGPQRGVELLSGMNREQRRELEKKARKGGKKLKRRLEADTRALLAKP